MGCAALRGMAGWVGPGPDYGRPLAAIRNKERSVGDASLLRAVLQGKRPDLLEAPCGFVPRIVCCTLGGIGADDGKVFPSFLPCNHCFGGDSDGNPGDAA